MLLDFSNKSNKNGTCDIIVIIIMITIVAYITYKPKQKGSSFAKVVLWDDCEILVMLRARPSSPPSLQTPVSAVRV